MIKAREKVKWTKQKHIPIDKTVQKVWENRLIVHSKRTNTLWRMVNKGELPLETNLFTVDIHCFCTFSRLLVA